MKRQTGGSSGNEELEVTGGGGGGGTVDQGTAGVDPWLVRGAKSHNAAAPTSDNLGVLPAVASAAAPTYTEGRQVLLSTDLTGALRVAATISTAGLATEAKQDVGNTSLASIDTKLTSPLTVQATNLDIRDLVFASDKVDASGSAVTVSSSALPTGAATAARQDTGNTSLASIDSKLTSPLTVQATNLDIRDLVFASDKVDVSGSSNVGVTGPLTDAELRATPVPVSGTVTAAQATAANLNATVVGTGTFAVQVSSSALPTGAATLAEQQTQTTALQIIDDWDESDRAKVNLVVGQAGITAGAGAVAANTPRVTLASDDPAVVALQVIDDWDESDRAKVNIIVGQAGITAGAGAVAANTPRVTHASDDPVVTALQIIDDWDESDRAKVNPIVGQAGVAADAGATSASTIRVVPVTRATPVKHFIGTAQTVISTATDIAAGNFSGAPSSTYDNTSDAAYPYAPYALAMLEAPDWAAAPVAGTTVDLFGILKDIDGTDDETDAPSGTSAGGAHYFGSWYIAAADALQRRVIVINTLGYNLIDFYIRNGTAQNMNNDAGTSCVVKVSPLTTGYPF